MKSIIRYISILLLALTATAIAQAYTLKVKGMPEEIIEALNGGPKVFNLWGDVGTNHYYSEDLTQGIEVEAGQTVKLNAYGQQSFVVEKWVVDGENKGPGSPYEDNNSYYTQARTITFTMPAHNCTVEAWMKYVPPVPDEPKTEKENYKLKVESDHAEHIEVEFFVIKDGYYYTHSGSSGSSGASAFAWVKPDNNYGYYSEAGVFPGDSVAVWVKITSNGWRFNRLEENGRTVWDGQMEYLYDSNTGNYTIKLYTFVMPKHDVTLKAYAVFDPDAPGNTDRDNGAAETPGNPGSNRWMASTGEVFINNITKGRTGYTYINNVSSTINELKNEYQFEWDDVKQLTVVGDLSKGTIRENGWRMFDYVIELPLSSFTSLETLDLRNTNHLSMTSADYEATFVDGSGTRVTDDMLTHIVSWGDLPSIKKLLLPSCLKGFYREWGNESFFFDELPGLKELTIYAVTPPKVDGDMLSSVINRVTLYVPENSVAAYKADPKWGKFKSIQAIRDNEAQTVTVSLPADCKDGRYANMSIVLMNLLNEDTKRYVVDDNRSYTYRSIPSGAHVVAQLRTTSNIVLAQTDTVIMGDRPVELSLGSQRKLHNLSLQVIAGSNNDVTDQCTVTWSDSKGARLSNTPQLDRQIEGTAVYYDVKLPNDLASRYLQPEKTEVMVGNGSDTITVKPEVMDSVTVAGVVRNANGERVAATVSISQQMNGTIGKSFVTTTDATGRFSLRALSGKVTLAASATGYLTDCHELTLKGDFTDTLTLQPINGSVITCSMTWTPTVSEGETATTQPTYTDYQNVALTAYNETTRQLLDSISIQYPDIILMDGAKAGDHIRLTATSMKEVFMPNDVTVTIGNDERATVTIPLVELGGIEASFTQTENSEVNALLYDADGLLLNVYPFSEAKQTISNLKDGQYTLVMMAENSLYGKLATVGEFAAVGLKQGEDYVQNNVTVKSGIFTKVHQDKVPTFDEKERYYTDDENTSLMLNKSEVGAGSNVTLRSQITFKDEYKDKVTNVRLVVDIPTCGEMVEGSAMTGSRVVSDGTFTSGRVTIPIPQDDLDKVIRFIITTTQAGTLRPQAYAQFRIGGREVLQPIGTVSCTVKGITMDVPETVCDLSKVYIKGTAPALSYVRVMADDIEVGKVQSRSDGTWYTNVELPQYPNLSKISVRGEITTPRGIKVSTETSTMTYDQDFIKVEHVYMEVPSGDKNVIDFDFNAPEKLDGVYYGCHVHEPNPFNFSVEFNTTDSTKVSDVTVIAYTVNGQVHYVPCSYEKKSGAWVGFVKLLEDGVNNIDVTYMQNERDIKTDADALNFDNNLLAAINDNISSFRTEIHRLLDVMSSGDAAQRLAALDKIWELIGFDPSESDIEVPEGMTFEQAVEFADKTIAELNLTNDMMSGMDLYTADLGNNISVSHATGLTVAQLLSSGYEEYNTTDGHKYYLLTEENHSVYVDFAFDIRIEVRGEAAKMLTRAGGGFDLQGWINGIQGFLTMLSATVSDLKNGAEMIRKWIVPIIQETNKALSYINTTYRYAGAPPLNAAQKLSFETLKVSKWLHKGMDKILFTLQNYGVNPSEAFELFSNAPANTPLVKTIQNSAKVLGKIGNVLSYVGIIQDIMEGIDKVKKLVELEAAVPTPCKDDQEAATKLKKDIGTFIVTQAAWYSTLALADVGSLEAMNKGLLAIPIPPIGFSMSAVLGGAAVALGKMALNFANGIWYEDQVQQFYQRINALDCDYDRWKQKVRVSYLAEKRQAAERAKRFRDLGVAIDPSGFVYEAVADNRVEYATATIFFKQTGEDEWGDQHDETVMWNATEFGQQNPLYTDAEGKYAWDVPKGLWQVKIEKEGYETAYSDWLPVPPPQLDINIGLRQNTLPDIQTARAYEDVVVLEFNKYMRPHTLSDNIMLSKDGKKLDINIEMQDWAQAWESDSAYVRRLFLRPKSPFSTGEKLTLTVGHEVESYTGLQMQQDYQQEFTVVNEVRQLGVDSLVEVPFNGDRTFSVLAYPGSAAKGKKVIATIQTAHIASVVSVGTFDENGIARIAIHGDYGGTSRLTLQLEGTDIETSALIEVVGAESMPVATPMASRISGTSVMKGETVSLFCDTEGATIYYTLDGTCPCDENGTRKTYTGPITINSHMILKAYAVKGEQQESRVATFEYFIIGETGIDSLTVDNPHGKPVAYYTLDGQRLNRPQKGVIIVQYEDGTSHRLMVK